MERAPVYLIRDRDRSYGAVLMAPSIGRQAEPLAPEIARTRMEAVKSDAAGVSPVSKGMLFGKAKAWFTTEKVLEPAD